MSFFKKYLFLERGEGMEREGEKHQCVLALECPLTGPDPKPRHVP